jgi:hypothetical protein
MNGHKERYQQDRYPTLTAKNAVKMGHPSAKGALSAKNAVKMGHPPALCIGILIP